MATARPDKAYARLAHVSEYSEASRVLTRAFAKNTGMNWFGCVKTMVPDCNSQTRQARLTMKRLYTFQSALLKAMSLVGGLVLVVVIPIIEGQEKVVAVSLWLKPGQDLDFGLSTVLRSGLHKVIFGWGFQGVKRLLLEFTPAVELMTANAFKARGLDKLDSWYILEIAVDPDYEGKGLCSLMMKDGFNRAAPKPVHLEATEERTRDIYARFGFEVDEEHQFGRGKVDSNGLKASGSAATGFPEWIMTKILLRLQWTY